MPGLALLSVRRSERPAETDLWRKEKHGEGKEEKKRTAQKCKGRQWLRCAALSL